MLRNKVNSLGSPCDQSCRRKEGYGGGDLQKSKVLAWNEGMRGDEILITISMKTD